MSEGYKSAAVTQKYCQSLEESYDNALALADSRLRPRLLSRSLIFSLVTRVLSVLIISDFRLPSFSVMQMTTPLKGTNVEGIATLAKRSPFTRSRQREQKLIAISLAIRNVQSIQTFKAIKAATIIKIVRVSRFVNVIRVAESIPSKL